MTRYEGVPNNDWSTVNDKLCTGWMTLYFDIETAPRPDNPKLTDWFIKITRITDTTCYPWFDCSRKTINLINYGTNTNYSADSFGGMMQMGWADDDPRHPNIPVIPKWPAPNGKRKLPNGNTLSTFKGDFSKAFYLGCCSDGCDQVFGQNAMTESFTLNGTVNADDLPDPLSYNGVPPSSHIWIEVDKVAAHAYLEAMRQFGQGGSNPPKFPECCRGGGSGAGAGSAGNSNG